MIDVKEIIIVEGAYDKIKLSSFINGIIYATGGFSIIRDKKRTEELSRLCEKNGAVILTDSDSAGFKIRAYLTEKLPKDKIKQAYVPDLYGKERRKRIGGKEGLLGVEGMSEEIITEALKKAGVTIDGTCDKKIQREEITKSDFFALGLSGGDNSRELRTRLLNELGLPSKLSSNMMLKVINRLMDKKELVRLTDEINM